MQSAGAHCATDFLIRYGCISQFEEEMPDKIRKFLYETYGAYEYGYTATHTDVPFEPQPITEDRNSSSIQPENEDLER